MGQRLKLHFIAGALAIFVSGFSFSSWATQAAPAAKRATQATPVAKPVAEKKKEQFTALTFQELRPRLLIRADGKAIAAVDRDPNFINAKADGYEPELNYTEELHTYGEKQLFRILCVSRSDDFQYTGTDMADTGYNLVHMTLQPVDANLKAVGESFEVATKAKPDEKVKEFLGDTFERTSRLSSLTFSRAQVRDVLLNPLEVETPQGVIPGNSKSQIIAIEKERRPWTFTYNYHLTVRVSPCPESLRDNNCQARIENFSYLPDSRFGHWVHPSNVRSWKIWGVTIVY